MLIGDGRKYCSALFTLDVGAILRDKHGMDPLKYQKSTVQSTLESFGKNLQTIQKVKKYMQRCKHTLQN